MRKKMIYVFVIFVCMGTITNAQFTLQNAFPNLSFSDPVFVTHSKMTVLTEYLLSNKQEELKFSQTHNLFQARKNI